MLLSQGFTAEPGRLPAAFWSRRRRRGSRRRLAPAALLAAMLMALGSAAAAAGDGVGDEKGARLLALVNAARAESGLGRVEAEARLRLAACHHARDLARGGPLSHRGSDGSDLADRLAGSGYLFTMAAENLAAGVATPDETVWLWLGSPGHRRNILTREFNQAGIARISGTGGEIWVLVLATPQPTQPARGGSLQQPARRVQTERPPEAADLAGDNQLTCY